MGARPVILIVEDDAAFARLTEIRLVDALEDVDVRIASSVSSAAELSAVADCVLLDLGLPEGRGLDAIDDLRAAGQTGAIVVLSGNPDAALANSALEAGAAAFVAKSAPVAALVATVASTL